MVRVEGWSSDFIIDTIGDGRLVHGMFRILLIVDRTYISHGEVEVSRSDAEGE